MDYVRGAGKPWIDDNGEVPRLAGSWWKWENRLESEEEGSICIQMLDSQRHDCNARYSGIVLLDVDSEDSADYVVLKVQRLFVAGRLYINCQWRISWLTGALRKLGFRKRSGCSRVPKSVTRFVPFTTLG